MLQLIEMHFIHNINIIKRKICDNDGTAYFASPVNIPVFFGKPRFDAVAGILDEEPPFDEGWGSEARGLLGKGFVVPLLEPGTGFPLPPPIT